MKTTKKTLLAAALLAAIGATTSAQAGMLFNFQNGQGDVSVGSWDWDVTSFVAVNGSQAVENFAAGTCSTTSCDFTILTHASLTGVKDKDGITIGIDGLNGSNSATNFEITVQLAFTETVVGLTGTPGIAGSLATFAMKPKNGEFLEIFYDTAKNANPLTGFGYNDGRLILKADEITSSSGTFNIKTDTPVQLDQFTDNTAASDNYGNGSGTIGLSQLSLSGEGNQGEFAFGNFPADGSYQDPIYFKSILNSFGMNFNNLSINLPFGQTNPSDCFSDATSGIAVSASTVGPQKCANVHFDGLYSAQGVDANGGYVPVVGNINGIGPSSVNGGKDFVAQTDYNSSFATVPEPASVALLGIGLVGLGFTRFRKQRIA